MESRERFTRKELEGWVLPCDNESLKKAGTFHLGVNQVLTSPFVRETWLELISSSNFLNEYELIENGRTWFTIDSSNRDITKPVSITGGKYATVSWRALNHRRHRENGLPSDSFSGVNRWIQYGLLHRVDGPAFAYEKYDDEKYSLWNLNVDEILIPRHDAQRRGRGEVHTSSYHLFGQKLNKSSYDKIIDFSLSTKVPIEVAFILINNSSDLTEWDVNPTLPLTWQIKLAESLAPNGQNFASVVIHRWLQNKYSLEHNTYDDFESDL